MKCFKAYILLGLLLALLVISSNGAEETSKDKKKVEKAEGKPEVAGYGGGGGHGGGSWGGGSCHYGCCGHNQYGGCKCCQTAEEAIAYMKSEAQPSTESVEGKPEVAGYGAGYGGGGGGGSWGGGSGGHGSGGCRYGCCGHNQYGGCKCCQTAEEAIAYMKSEAQPSTESVEGKPEVAGYGGGGGGGSWGGGSGGSGGCRYGCCGHNQYGGCRCCQTTEEAKAYMKSVAKPLTESADGKSEVAGYGGGGGGGGWGGGSGGHGGGGGGGGCRYGCCGHNRYGGCKCCQTAEKAIAFHKSEAKP